MIIIYIYDNNKYKYNNNTNPKELKGISKKVEIINLVSICLKFKSKTPLKNSNMERITIYILPITIHFSS